MALEDSMAKNQANVEKLLNELKDKISKQADNELKAIETLSAISIFSCAAIITPLFIYSKLSIIAYTFSIIYIIIYNIIIHIDIPVKNISNITSNNNIIFNSNHNHYIHHRNGLKNYNFGTLFVFWDIICNTKSKF
jgi:sterol desaturase/sphingolipid hydroxylase (fatty acid hydroxylase superfamily)